MRARLKWLSAFMESTSQPSMACSASVSAFVYSCCHASAAAAAAAAAAARQKKKSEGASVRVCVREETEGDEMRRDLLVG
jgi:hypothetical protein